jgi:hypothetical protein
VQASGLSRGGARGSGGANDRHAVGSSSGRAAGSSGGVGGAVRYAAGPPQTGPALAQIPGPPRERPRLVGSGSGGTGGRDEGPPIRHRSPPPPRRRPEAPRTLPRPLPAPRERERTPPRPSPPRGASRYLVKLPRDAIYVRERNLQNVAMRHVDLYVPSEFTRSFALWLDLIAGPQRVPLDKPVKFTIVAPSKSETREGSKEGDPKDDNGEKSTPADVKHEESATPQDEKLLEAPVKAESPDEAAMPAACGPQGSKPEAAAPVAKDWSKLTVAALKSELSKRGLPTKGNKADLVKRIAASTAAAADAGADAMEVDTPGRTSAEPLPVATPQPVNADSGPVSHPVRVEATPERPADVIGPDGSCGHWWHAKVLIVGGLPASKLRSETPRGFMHPLNMPFLMRKRPKAELMLFGGAWSPADGAHPAVDPASLVQTAIRTVHEQAGVDLKACLDWPRLLELQFRRGGTLKSGDTGHLQRTIIFAISAAQVAEPNAVGISEVRAAEVCAACLLFQCILFPCKRSRRVI